jgi:hypothetical protein
VNVYRNGEITGFVDAGKLSLKRTRRLEKQTTSRQ